MLDRYIQYSRIVTAVVDITRRNLIGELIGLNQVFTAQFYTLDTQYFRSRIYQSFQYPVTYIRPCTPENSLLIFIGQHGPDARLNATNGVWSADLRHHVSVARDSKHEIGTIIIYCMHAQTQELALFGHSQLGIIHTVWTLTIVSC